MPTKKERDEYLRGLNPIDDLMFRKMAEHKEFCEEILRVILGDKELVVTDNMQQFDIKNIGCQMYNRRWAVYQYRSPKSE